MDVWHYASIKQQPKPSQHRCTLCVLVVVFGLCWNRLIYVSKNGHVETPRILG